MARKKRKGYIYHVNALGLQKDMCAISSRQAKLLYALDNIERMKEHKFSVNDNSKFIKHVMRTAKVVKTRDKCEF